ncbi:molybdopterin molybdotransferase MoeA [Aequorivita echinoideorum]|uniref:Molybdopterin molybdenumtransferase n=1 Tax=Aequorivita echinoideorum TaxID=1549647 RepID=A0ABS5S4H7_9FLAO|nr:molybdopterin molybdotransferase MoeA [Aequorivita echinoideorum]MBT0608122.1 molybdopterin molybdotransferase MoeA [Aequorivita echinoideorum]
MISYSEALENVLKTATDFGVEKIPLLESVGRVLDENITADRDFPPFDRVTKDGIALNSDILISKKKTINIEAIFAAGSQEGILKNKNNCVEIMTGAMLPKNTDTVIMYEDISIENGGATLKKSFSKGQNVHKKGSDRKAGEVILKKNRKITAREIGVLATVGKTEILVKKLPKIAVISTGDELISIDRTPLPHQIRSSNNYSLYAALAEENIIPNLFHLKDEKTEMKDFLENLVKEYDILLLSGGVSKGKFDFLPGIFEELKVEKIFHRVLQQPGKPLWFGKQEEEKTIVFSFPGNPVSTFVNFHIYFKNWLRKSLQIEAKNEQVFLSEFENTSTLTRFLLAEIISENEKLTAKLIEGNGSGDLISLTKAAGVVIIPPKTSIKNESVDFIKF